MPVAVAPTSPRTAQLITSPGIVTWSNGYIFDGFLWLGLSLPTGYTNIKCFGSQLPQEIPRYIKVPIIAGQLDQTTQIFYTTDMDPPATQYFAYWFDRNNQLITPDPGTAVGFVVSTPVVTIAIPTLTLPSVGPAPTPQGH
jgi:hypothetical protein